MSKKRRRSFHTPSKNRNGVLLVALLQVLAEQDKPIIFTDLFDLAYALPAVKEAYPTMNEEMMRLRFYEQLQNLVTSGRANKDKKAYELSEFGRKEAAE